MASKKIGVQMIEMYCGMIKERLKPALSVLDQRNELYKKLATVKAKKELGIYDAYVERFKLKTRLDELEKQIREVERQKHVDGEYRSPLSMKVDEIVETLKTEEEKEVANVYKQVMWDVKMMGVDEDVRRIMLGLDDILKGMIKNIQSLPPISISEQDMLIEGEGY